MDKETFIALQMACELRQLITDRLEGIPELGLSPDCYPLPPLDNETFEDSCRRIFGDYIYMHVMLEHVPTKKKYPVRYYKNFVPKGPLDGYLTKKGV